jgi:hypothetical protein
MSRETLPPIFCRHCGAKGEPPELASYLVSNRNGKFTHVWLHPECSDAWHAKWRAWRFNGAKEAA